MPAAAWTCQDTVGRAVVRAASLLGSRRSAAAWRLLTTGLGSLASTPVWTRYLRLVVPLNEVPLEDLLTTVAAAQAGVKVIAGDRFPAVLPCDPAAHERPGVPNMPWHQRSRVQSTTRFHGEMRKGGRPNGRGIRLPTRSRTTRTRRKPWTRTWADTWRSTARGSCPAGRRDQVVVKGYWPCLGALVADVTAQVAMLSWVEPDRDQHRATHRRGVHLLRVLERSGDAPVRDRC